MDEFEENIPYVPLELLDRQKEEGTKPKRTQIEVVKEIVSRAPFPTEVQKNVSLYNEWFAELKRALEKSE